MAYFLLVVEGSHDAAFFGQLLRQRGLSKVGLRREVDPYWEKLIPAKFPANPEGKLDHVIKYPDIYESQAGAGQISVAIAVAGGDSKLILEFQSALEILDITRLRSAGIVSDADKSSAERIAGLVNDLNKINAAGTHNSLPGFPLTVPQSPGVANGTPRIGLHVFPDNQNTGTLETILLACAATSYAPYCEPAIAFVAEIDKAQPPDCKELKSLRRGVGRHKAAAGMISNLLFPGHSLSVAIERGSWLTGTTGNEIGLAAAHIFLDSMLS
jgi:hypothetical protein